MFSSISKKLYDEEYVLKVDKVTCKGTGGYIYKFSAFNANLSSGKKMGEISCFDIAYTMYAKKYDIPCLNFLLTDKKELMSDNQLLAIGKVVEEENIQFVASILKDKLPDDLQDKRYYIVELSEHDKLFRFWQIKNAVILICDCVFIYFLLNSWISAIMSLTSLFTFRKLA